VADRRVLLLVGIVLGLALLPALAGCAEVEADEPSAIDESNDSVGEEPATEEGEEAGAEEPPAPKLPKPVVVRGSGKKVATVRLKRDGPVVITGRHRGSANFIVHLVGQGIEEYIFNEIGTYNGQAAIAEGVAGRYRMPVEADGSWTVRFEHPVPTGNERSLLGTHKGQGAKVLRLRIDEAAQPIFRAKHRGQANFIVHLIGYGDVTGEMSLFNEIGSFSGEALAESELPGGTYLMWVQADGRWTIRVAP